MSGGLPTVTVAIPLYRSLPFVPVIQENILALDYPALEIIVSDRHGLDAAMDVLQHQFGGDSRIRFERSTDGIGFAEHFNALVRMATGDYIVVMQHDNTYPPNYLHLLVEKAVTEPKPVVTFGTTQSVWLDRDEHDEGFGVILPMVKRPDTWGLDDCLRLLFAGYAGVPSSGLILRSTVLGYPSLMIETRNAQGSESVWLFALALCAPLRFVQDCVYLKRHHPASATRALASVPLDWLDHVRVMAWYATNFPMSRRNAAVGLSAMLLFSLMRIFYQSVLKVALPRRLAVRFRDAFRFWILRKTAGPL